MSITVLQEGKLLTLHTAHTSYQMKVDSYGYLEHLYYGARLTDGDDLSCNLKQYDRGFSGQPYEARANRTFSPDTIPQEYTGCGLGDYRISSIGARNADGSFAADFRYVSHSICTGAAELTEMPSAFGTTAEAETLEITLVDQTTGLTALLCYVVFEASDVIARSVTLRNGGTAPLILTKAASICMDFPFGTWDLTHFHGRHCMERQPERHALISGIEVIGSKRGMSSHQHNPFVILSRPETGEEFGDCCGLMLVYSGSHQTELEVDQMGSTRVVMGIHPDGFQWKLEPSKALETPQVLLSWTTEGLTALSHQYHHFIKKHIMRHALPQHRPVLINSWEAAYFDFNEEKLLTLAKQGAELGMDLFVLDDGWFGKRNNDNSGLGDWFVNETKLEHGMDGLIAGVNALGMQFGLWVEPEMVNEDSALYHLHPDWAMQIPDRAPVLSRNQLVLDMSRRDVQDYLYDSIADLLRTYSIAYIKWDMNRCVSDAFSAALPAECQGEGLHRYVLGVYRLAKRLTDAFPEVLFEGCAGGGGRFDCGMLAYFPQIWCSDDTDAIQRLTIQYGTSFGYPTSAMGAHVSAVPNHQTGRTTPTYTRGIVAMAGSFGYELALGQLTEKEKKEIRTQIATFRRYDVLLKTGDYYRLTDPTKNRQHCAWMVVAPDASEALLSVVVMDCRANAPLVHVCLKGLDSKRRYRIGDTDVILSGSALLHGGYTFPQENGDYPACQVHLTAVD